MTLRPFFIYFSRSVCIELVYLLIYVLIRSYLFVSFVMCYVCISSVFICFVRSLCISLFIYFVISLVLYFFSCSSCPVFLSLGVSVFLLLFVCFVRSLCL